MIDHVELRTGHLEEAVQFYRAVLRPLGYEMVVDGKSKGFGAGDAPDFFLVPGEPVDKTHYAFRASSRSLVRACCDAGSKLGALDRVPALAPHVHPTYYAGYLRDPDGRLVEFTCHADETQNG